jgi:site-specific DNA recombinase
VWNRREFLKDPDTGKRRSVERPPNEWRIEEHPDLRVIDDALAEAVAARIKMLAERYDAGRTIKRAGASCSCP